MKTDMRELEKNRTREMMDRWNSQPPLPKEEALDWIKLIKQQIRDLDPAKKHRQEDDNLPF